MSVSTAFCSSINTRASSTTASLVFGSNVEGLEPTVSQDARPRTRVQKATEGAVTSDEILIRNSIWIEAPAPRLRRIRLET
jgi:hypothetical protein